MALGEEIWGPVSGPAGSSQAVTRALGRCSFDFTLLAPGLLAGNEWSAPGKTQIPVNVRSLANFAQEAETHGWREGEHYHAIIVNPQTGELVDHDDIMLHGRLGVVTGVAPAVLGLFWFSGLVEVEETLLANPLLFDEVFHAEGAHATDFFYMLPTGKRDVLHAFLCAGHARHAWFQPTPYFQMPGEGVMGIFVRAYTTLAVTLQGFSHTATDATVTFFRNLLTPVVEPPAPPPPPPEPEPEPVEIAPDIWDARPYIARPAGMRPMGAVIGIATHHTVASLRAQAEQERVRAVTTGDPYVAATAPATEALALGDALAFDSTWQEEVAFLKAIDRAHTANPNIGIFAYQMMVMKSGRNWLCGNLDGQRAHVAGRNHELEGLAFEGDYTSAELPEGMKIAGAKAIRYMGDHADPPDDIRGHRDWGTATICAGTISDVDWAPYLDPGLPPPPPTGVRVSQVVRTPTGYLVRFAGSGTVEIPEGAEWPLEVVSEDGALTAEIRAP
jgi:hypothetical protein